MDFKTTSRICSLLILFALFVHTTPTSAHHSLCLLGFNDHNPPELRPLSAEVCSPQSGPNVSDLVGTGPCGGGLWENATGESNHARIFIDPPANYITSADTTYIGWLVAALDTNGDAYNGAMTFVFSVYNPNGSLHSQTMVTAVAGAGVPGDLFPANNGLGLYHQIEAFISTAPNSYVTVEMTNPQPNVVPQIFYFSPKYIKAGNTIPNHCNIPPVTPTPTPPPATATMTPTPPPANTATATPPQATGTAPVATSTQPPATAPVLATIQGEGTPTPFSVPTLSPIDIGTPDLGDIFGDVSAWPTAPSLSDVALTPNATTEARITAVETLAAENGLVLTRWHTSTQSAFTAVSGGGLVSSTVEIGQQIETAVAYPLSLLKFLQTYLPATWILIRFMLILVTWIFFVLVFKFSISVIGEPIELLRKIIELIPGF